MVFDEEVVPPQTAYEGEGGPELLVQRGRIIYLNIDGITSYWPSGSSR